MSEVIETLGTRVRRSCCSPEVGYAFDGSLIRQWMFVFGACTKLSALCVITDSIVNLQIDLRALMHNLDNNSPYSLSSSSRRLLLHSRHKKSRHSSEEKETKVTLKSTGMFTEKPCSVLGVLPNDFREKFLCVISIDSRGRIYFMISLRMINIKIISNLSNFYRIIETYDYARRGWTA